MAKIDQQVAVVKSLVGDQLNPKQLEELMTLSDVDLMIEHGLTDSEAEKVLTHAKREMYRMRAQGYSFGTLDPEERAKVSYPHPPTRTSPVYEARAKRGKRLTEAKLRRAIKRAILEESPTVGALPLSGIPALGAAPMSSRPRRVNESEFTHPSGDPLDHGVTDETYWADVFMDEMRDFISQYGASAWDDGMAETVRAAVLDGLERAIRDADSLADEARGYPE